MRTRLDRLLLVPSLLVILAACSAGGGGNPTVSGAWARPSVGSDKPVAAYMTIANPSDQSDRLLGVSSPIAGSVEIHETSTDAGGMTGMHPIDGIDVPAGGSVTLEPGGYHLMIMDLTEPLEVGDTLDLQLDFERAGQVAVKADVRQG